MISSDTSNQSNTPSQALPPVMEPAEASPIVRPLSRRYSMIFGVTLSVVTLIALVVAFFASDFRPRASAALPASWSQVYSADLTGSDDGKWDETQGCVVNALGLDATATSSSDAQCVFTPSAQENLTGGGFYFETQLAPAAKVPSFVRSIISIGDVTDPSAAGGAVIHFIVGQDGSYTLCDGACTQTSGSIYQHGGLAAWHGNALLANTIAVKVSPDHSALTVFVNDQEVATVAPQFGPQPAIAVGALSGSEAIFTHVSLYTDQTGQ